MKEIVDRSKLNKSINIKLQKPKGFLNSGLFSSSAQSVFKVPPLNAVIESGYGKGPEVNNKGFKGFQAGNSVDNTNDIPFLNWSSIRSNKFDDPNKHRIEQLEVYEILKPINQDCCGSCWAVSSSMTFADRFGIANDFLPINPSIISIMSCCTKQMHKNVFAVVETPDCDIMSSYSELGSSGNSMGMCAGGIPFSAGLSMFRNGLPDDKDTKYTSELFLCNKTPSFPNMNQSLIDNYPCSEEIFKKDKIKMESKPIYISSSQGPPGHYVELMKKALLEGGPLVGGFMVLGDFLGLGTDGAGLGSDGDQSKMMNWDSTGKVYVSGAYDEIFPFVSINGVGGSTTIQVVKTEGEQSVVNDTGLKPKTSIGSIFCGFHAVVIVGWGEMDLDYIDNKDVKTIDGKDGRPKLPFWICRNSWGPNWPIGDYYKDGVKVMVDKSPEILEIPGGYWLHAMYPNESMALDVPLNYEGTDYGSTMVMIPEKINNPKVTDSANTGSLVPKVNKCNTSWKDSEGYNCSQYSEFGWCEEDGSYGDGWKEEWGKFGDFKNESMSATDICCECGSSSNEPEGSSEIDVVKERIIMGLGIFIPLLLLTIVLIFMVLG